MNKTSALVLLLLMATVTTSAQKIYWGDSVPKGWNGKWPARLLTVPEKTNFERTAMTMDVLEFIDALRWNSDKVHVFSVYTSPLRKICPAIVLANPRVTTPEKAAKSGKTVVYLQGNIHPYEMEGKESLLILAREILLGKLTPLLDHLIIIICPNFNVDGNDMVNVGLEVFTHGGTDNTWPPTIWGPGEAIWSNEAKFVANAYGLRNRMSILAETPGHESFERRIYAHVALMTEVLRYAAANGQEMKEVCRRADAAVVEAARTKAESGELRNFVAGKYESYGKVDILMYRERNASELVPGTSVRGKMASHMLGEPELVKGVEFMAKAVGTASATMPRGYLIPAELDFIAEKLRTHNVKVEVLTKPIKVSGEEFVIDKIGQGRGDGYAMIKLDGGFAKSPVKEFPAGTFRVDLAQPMANVAFYMLEPQAADGFVGSGVFDAVFKSLGADRRSVVYPIYKYFKVLD